MTKTAKASATRGKADSLEANETVNFKKVFESEVSAIKLRRAAQQELYPNYPTQPSIPKDFDVGEKGPVLDAVGLALSGGGIRSTAFCLGALQALDAAQLGPRVGTISARPKKRDEKAPSVLERVDYLSTVSGGGYIGCCLSAGLSNCGGAFPFKTLHPSGETPSIKHIRDHSNYLFPDSRLDVLDSIAIYIRGLMANAVIVASVMLVLVVLTIACSPMWESLSKPRVFNFVHDWLFPKALDDPQRSNTGAFLFTKLFFVLMLLFFIVWGVLGAIVERMRRAKWWRRLQKVVGWWRQFRNGLKRWWRARRKTSLCAQLRSIFQEAPDVTERNFVEASSPTVRVAGYVLATVVVSAFCEVQPVAIHWLFAESDSASSSAQFVQIASAVLGVLAVVIGFFANKLEVVAKTVAAIPGWKAYAKWIVSRSAILFAGVVLPFVLWLSYLALCYWGIKRDGDYAAQTLLSEFAQNYFRTPAEFSANLVKYIGNSPILPQIIEWLSYLPFSSTVISWFLGALDFIAVNVTPIAALYFLLAVILFFISLFPTLNANSLHRLYRDRLSRAFVFSDSVTEAGPMRWLRNVTSSWPILSKLLRPTSAEMENTNRDGLKFLDRYKLSELSERCAPYHLINAALNIQGSRYVNRRGRNADFFIFSRNYVGSEATKYVATKRMEGITNDLTLATAMAVSGAAASANMGSSTIRLLAPTLAILNVRLGYWLRNPIAAVGSALNWKRMLAKTSELANLYFFKELLSLLNEKSFNVYLTDGGHIENLGIYQLLKRRCRLIIAVDAEADPKMNFLSFVKLQRHARIDLDAIIDLPWRRLRAVSLETGANITATGGAVDAETRKGPHCVIGSIQYLNSKEPAYLVYVKASLSGDENDYIVDYKRRYERFPHETTGDQFFTEEQFEVYRALGFHCMRGFLKGKEEMPTFGDRLAEKGPTPPMYRRPLSPKGLDAINKIRGILGLPAPLF